MVGETRTPQFLAEVNANGRIPVLQVGERFLPESNAACWYLAEGSALIPPDPWDRADMLRWMFWEQYNHEPTIATLRFWLYFIGEANLNEVQRVQLPGKRATGEAALALMDEHLDGREWFAGRRLARRHRALRLHSRQRGRRLPARGLRARLRLAARVARPCPATFRWIRRFSALAGAAFHRFVEPERDAPGHDDQRADADADPAERRDARLRAVRRLSARRHPEPVEPRAGEVELDGRFGSRLSCSPSPIRVRLVPSGPWPLAIGAMPSEARGASGRAPPSGSRICAPANAPIRVGSPGSRAAAMAG